METRRLDGYSSGTFCTEAQGGFTPLSLPRWGSRRWRSCSPAQLPHWQGRSARACLAALSWSGVLHVSIPRAVTHLSSCRRFTRSALPWKRSWSSFVLSPSCDSLHGRAGAEQCPAALQGEEFCAAEQGLYQGRGEHWPCWLSLCPITHILPLQVRKVQKTNTRLWNIS